MEPSGHALSVVPLPHAAASLLGTVRPPALAEGLGKGMTRSCQTRRARGGPLMTVGGGGGEQKRGFGVP